MNRKLHLLVVVAALAGVVGLGAVMSRPRRTEGWVLQGKEIHVHGRDYTLERLAREIADPEVLSYDAASRKGVAKASLVVHGGLSIGQADDPAREDTLELDTVVCGDLRLEVARRGELRVHRAIVTTVKQILTAEQCSQGYALLVEGTLRASDAKFLYMSGSRTQTARDAAQVDFERVTFTWTDGCSFWVARADGARLDIRDSAFKCEGQFGFLVEDSGGAPIVLRRCDLGGQLADLALTGRRPAAELVDCQFRRDRIRFLGNSGRVAVRWTVVAKAVEPGTGKPAPGLDVVATSTGPGPAETATGRTCPDGSCSLVLTEYVAMPDYPIRSAGYNNVTPHRIELRSPSGQTLGTPVAHDARSPGAVVTLDAQRTMQ